MKQGFILDHKDYASSVVAQWQPGEPQNSFWRGVQSKDGPHYEITAYGIARLSVESSGSRMTYFTTLFF
jgi:hypothetical protein